jgi:hypothetical protein
MVTRSRPRDGSQESLDSVCFRIDLCGWLRVRLSSQFIQDGQEHHASEQSGCAGARGDVTRRLMPDLVRLIPQAMNIGFDLS